MSPSYPRIQQRRLLARSAYRAVASGATFGLALAAASERLRPEAAALLITAFGLAVSARRSRRLADRNKVGADSEDAVRRMLDPLGSEGWRIRHGVRWPGGGDIDHLVRTPDGLGFAIETKTGTFREDHLKRIMHAARWAAGRRRTYPRGVVPVLCVVRSRGRYDRYGSIHVVSLDRLLPTLRRLAS